MKYTFKHAPKGDGRITNWGYKKEADKYIKLIGVDAFKCIYDIGANIMDHSIYYANELGSNVYSFEPVTEYYKMGLANIKDYGLKTVNAFNIGLGDEKSILKISKSNEGSSLISGSGPSSSVKVERLDDFAKKNKLPMPTLIKLDVEGFGAKALAGAAKTITKAKPVLIFEFHPHLFGMDLMKEKIAIVKKLGYRPVRNYGFEFVFEFGNTIKGNMSWSTVEKKIYNMLVFKVRYRYDYSKSKKQLKELREEYKNRTFKVPFFKRLIWSKIFRIVTGKKAK